MSLNTTLIRPGLLVSLKTTVRGGVTYQKVDLEAEHQVGDAATEARWETTRIIANRAEYERAQKARTRARIVIGAVCCPSSFGMLCPGGRERDLDRAIEEAREVADQHNATARSTRVEVYVLTGRIADSDVEAARAIGSEMRGLIEEMSAGIKAADPSAIRAAANKARAMSGMLSPDVAFKVSEAIAQARDAARVMVRRIDKAGEQAATVIDSLVIDKLESARFAVLDLGDDQSDKIEAAAPAAPAIDLRPEGEAPAASQPAIPSFEL